ncbi:MAG: hypothetical protein GX638_14280, partial [Crenarchaeota archaeon]|nr:hypothetical protein [Thermoproteota archaeon]
MDAIVANFIQLLQDALNVDQITSEIITATIIFLSCVFITWVVHAIIERHFSKWAKKTKSSLDDKIIHEIKLPLLLIAILFGAYYSLETLSIIAIYRDTIRGVFIIAEIFAIAFMLTRISSILISWYGNLRAKQNKTVSNHLLFTFNKVIQII